MGCNLYHNNFPEIRPELMDSTYFGNPQLGKESVLENSENANTRPYIAHSDKRAIDYTANALGSTQARLQGSGIQHTGQGHFNVQGNVNITSNAPSDSKQAAEKCMKALFLTDPSEDKDMLKRKKGKRAGGTCEWILNTKELNDWLHLEETEQRSEPNGVLWLHGNPGTGKSTIAIYLTEELLTAFNEMENMTLAYFFCDGSFEKRKTATSIIRGLLYLLVQKHTNLLLKYILPKFKERGDQLFTSFDALWRVFLAAAADQDTGQKYCIIDALDECDNGSKEILLRQLHETFHCQEKSPPNLSILITSRPYPEIGEYLQGFTNADLASFDQARQDIDRCIRERVNDLAKKKKYTDKVKREIIDLLMDKAEGTFLWVGLACEELRGKPSKDAIQFLRDMPKGLVSLYANLLTAATEDETSDCVAIRRILSFVTVSFDALSVLELSEACQLHQDESDLETRLQYTRDQIASCRLLVVIHTGKVQLLHQSVRDFLTGYGSGFFVEKLEAHANAASCCIDNLIKGFHDEVSPESPLLNYATDYWMHHVGQAGEKFKIYQPQIPFFEANSNSMREWMERRGFPIEGHNFLHVAVVSGLPILVEYALGMREVYPITAGPAFNIKHDPNLPDESGFSPLALALQPTLTNWTTGLEIVEMLLKAGAIVTTGQITGAVHPMFGYRIDEEVALSLLEHMQREDKIEYMQISDEWPESKSMPSILAKYGDQMTTEERSIEALSFDSPGIETLLLMLAKSERRGQRVITEDIMRTAALNQKQGGELVELLLKYQGDQNLITGNVIFSAIVNESQRKRIIQLLYQHQSDKIKATSKTMETAAMEEKAIELLLQHQGYGPMVITIANMLYQGASKFGSRSFSIFFQLFLYSQRSLPSMDVIILAAVSVGFEKVYAFILFLIQEGGAHIVVTDKMMDVLLNFNIGNHNHRIDCIKLLFMHRWEFKFTGHAWTTIHDFMQNELGDEIYYSCTMNQEKILTREKRAEIVNYLSMMR